MYVWDERKRQSNLLKHRMDFADAHLVYEHPEKFTESSLYPHEPRSKDIAVLEIFGAFVTLVYTLRGADVRVISLRPSSRRERDGYERNRLGRSSKSSE